MQGFGFLRTKIANVGRIHVWDSSLAVRHVSTMHTHPWALHSTIISGELINQRFEEFPHGVLLYQRQTIKTGEGGGLCGEAVPVVLHPKRAETYGRGDWYEQDANEIHRSIPQDGTVTLMERTQGPPLEEASVYWPRGTSWVSAEPRPPLTWQIEEVIQYALARWDA